MTSKVLQLFLDTSDFLTQKSSDCKMIQRNYFSLLQQYLTIRYQHIDNPTNAILSQNILNKLLNILDQLLYISEGKQQTESLRHLIDQVQHVEVTISETRIKQIVCCKQEMIMSVQLSNKTQKILECTICGNKFNTSKKNNRTDKGEYQAKNTSYQAIKHFDVVFKYMFVNQMDHITTDIKEQLQSFMDRDQKSKVTIEDVRQYLKQLSHGKGGSKFNKLDAVIMQQLNGEQQVRLSNNEYSFIKDVYYQIVSRFYMANKQRQNTPSATFFIRCILDLFYKDYDPKRHKQLIKLIYRQKESTIHRIQKLWIDLVQQLNVPELKKQFADMMQQTYPKNN